MPSLSRLFIDRSIFWLTEEYPSKIEQCLDVLPAAALWARTDERSNSVGNLLIHLTGNVTEWMIGGVAQRPVTRNRAAALATRDGDSARTLFARLRASVNEAAEVIDKLSAAELEAERFIQGRETTVLGAIYHVVEHFAMHTGQIVLLTKIHAPGAIRFYDDSAAVAKPLWKRGDDVTKNAG
jgi:Protein of unknown function (DUF1572).